MAKTYTISDEAMKNRLDVMKEIRIDYFGRIEEEGYDSVLNEMKLQKGNNKTGKTVWTVSFIPVLDCPNCSGCKKNCYDLRNVCFQPGVQNDRARNSALRHYNPEKFWERVGLLVKINNVKELRICVGGDLRFYDFKCINKIAKENPRTDFLFFTKNYKGINKFMDKENFEPNVHKMMSAWIGMEMDNPHNIPVSHVLWEDGTTTAPEYGSVFCKGNCSQCHIEGNGCWDLKEGESVIFKVH